MKRTDPDYLESLSNELTSLDCHTEEGKRFRNIALRLVELNQQNRETTAAAVVALVDANRVINNVGDKLIPIINAMDGAQHVMRPSKENQTLQDEKHEAISLLRYIRKMF